jgi:iron complex outermembrane receptor protein
MLGSLIVGRVLRAQPDAAMPVRLSVTLARTIAFTLPMAVCATSVLAQTATGSSNTTVLAPIVVDATLEPETPASTVQRPAEDGTARPAADLGALLEDTLGVSVSKMGAHGGDISIRGQSQDRLAVINDGAMTFGACPNRMDPPTSSVAEATVDQVTVQRGYQTVTNGPPAPGGSVIVERDRPTFDQFTTTATLGASIETNGALRQGSATVTAGAAEGYIRAFAESSRADPYNDGNGAEIRSGFESLGGGLDLGWNIDSNTHLTFGVEQKSNDNVLFAGAGMDAVVDDTTTYRLKGERRLTDSGPLSEISFSLYGSTVDHLMDNYSLRTASGMKMVTNATSNTYGGSLQAEWMVAGAKLTTGLDHRINLRDATSQSGMAALAGDPSTISAYTWPDMSIQDTGLFAEGVVPFGVSTTVTLGARLDRVEVDADKADAKPQNTNPSARTLYSQYYGETDVTKEEYNVSGLMRVEHDFGGLSGWATVSRSVRTADATERGISRSSGANSWVGNPGLEPEKHHQLDLGLRATRSDWGASGGVWVDEVTDFITRDTARGQAGVLMSNGASIYRNVDARLAGFELEGQWKPADDWNLRAQVAYTYGENTSDGRPLYNIAPLEGMVEARYSLDDWTMGPRLRWAMTQTRVDDNASTGSALDVDKTSGYAVVDLFATWAPTESFELRAGISNVLDQTYANHISRSNGFDPTVVQVNEAGRSLSVGGRVTF